MPAERDLGVVGRHRRRLEEDPEYRKAALGAPSPTSKTGISEKHLERTAPTALSADANASGFDVENATKDELVAYAEANDIDVKKSDKVDEIRDQVRAAL